MTEFDDLCREAEDIDFETRCAILKGKSQEILPRFTSLISLTRSRSMPSLS